MNIFLRNWGFYSYKWKIPALIWSLILGIQLIILKQSAYANDGWTVVIGMHLQMCLLMVVFSNEKIDDERIKSLRYFSLKATLVVLLVSLYFFNNGTADWKFISIPGLYLGIFASVFYIIIFYLLLIFDPKFVFKERTGRNFASDKVGIILFSVYISLFILATILVFYMISSLGLIFSTK